MVPKSPGVDRLERRHLLESGETLLKNDPQLRPKENETVEDRVRRVRILVEGGNARAELAMALFYAKGLGVPKNPGRLRHGAGDRRSEDGRRPRLVWVSYMMLAKACRWIRPKRFAGIRRRQ